MDSNKPDTTPASSGENPKPTLNGQAPGGLPRPSADFAKASNSGSSLPKASGQKRHLGALPIAGLVLLSFLAGGAGSYAVVRSGLVTNEQTITNNRDKVVSQEGEVISEVAAKVSPSVVSITTQGINRESIFGGRVTQGAGSGIIISKDGYVLTNKHVIPEGTTEVNVVATDGTTYEDVAVVGRDSVNDLAFLKIQNVSNLTQAEIGDSTSVKVGQKVIAIGNALGEFQNTVSTGIISGLGRPVQAGTDGTNSEVQNLENLFQTDAAINPGNSGGPLLNMNGEVIGINTAVAQDAEGIGFAIPINDARGLIRNVLETGKVQRGLLGVRYRAIDRQLAKERELPVNEGALLTGSQGAPAILADGAASRAGLQDGDIIIEVNDEKITAGNSLAGLLGEYRPGAQVKLTILRGGQERVVEARLQG